MFESNTTGKHSYDLVKCNYSPSHQMAVQHFGLTKEVVVRVPPCTLFCTSALLISGHKFHSDASL